MIGTRWRKVFCALVLSAIVLVALHSHAAFDPLDDHPINGHRCLLCIAAHLPSTMSNTAVAPLPPAATALALVSPDVHGSREVQIAFSLYMRPPPAL